MKHNIKITILGLLIMLVLVIVGAFLYISKQSSNYKSPTTQIIDNYDPQINPADFSNNITNEYFLLPVGKKMIFEAKTEKWINEKIEIEILNETKKIEGVETIVYLDRVYNDGQLVEETRDYLAQHKNGDV